MRTAYQEQLSSLTVQLGEMCGLAGVAMERATQSLLQADLALAEQVISDHDRISLKPLAERSYIYDATGAEQGVMTNRNDPQNRSQVDLEDIPETVTESVLAAVRGSVRL